MTPTLAPQDAWEPLPASAWNADAARHLLRRAGWSAREAEVTRATREGLAATLERLFPARPAPLAKPRLVTRFEQNVPQMAMNSVKTSPEDRLRFARESNERSRIAIQELTVKWLHYALEPANAAVAKWTLFLGDVYVVSAEKVRNPAWLHRHLEILTHRGFGPAPELTKAISRSPAMVVYLDLNQSQRKAPNENFARELFELFVLGEGHYSEQDIKEAARAFTGYRAQPVGLKAGFNYVPQNHDGGEKTVFGAKGNFSGDDVIELAYSQKAAATFLPRELAKFYLSDTPLPPAHLEALGQLWRASGFELRALAQAFFGSRLFFAPEFRGTFIKSPVQFYLGLLADLDLHVTPIPRMTILPLRQMSQLLFYPPNVRGWLGGRSWINSSTLTARRQFVEQLFNPLDENALNADEQIEIVAARSNGIDRFTVSDETLAPFAALPPAAAAERLIQAFLAGPASPAMRENLAQFIAAESAPHSRARRLRRAVVTLLQSPEYQLC